MYLLAFAAFQLPLGVLLDRYGPRRVVAALLCVAAVGALVFGLARDFTMLSIGRALIGLGVSGGLMGAIKAFTLWFPLNRLALLNGLYLAAGGIGGLSATAPAEALLGPLGWRALFYVLAAMSVGAALLIFVVVPEKELPGKGSTLRDQIAGFGDIFASLAFWRIALPLVVCHAGYLTLQGLWLGPWLYDVAGQPRSRGRRLPAGDRARLYRRIGVLRRQLRAPGARRGIQADGAQARAGDFGGDVRAAGRRACAPAWAPSWRSTASAPSRPRSPTRC